MFAKDCPKFLEKREWENVICSVCMECPHKAVLLLCSSYDKGCRPYMCGTSFRYSNCFDLYKKASAKLINLCGNLKCPLCRGQVKGWTIVQPARDYLNLKKRTCMQENCVFAGTFKELRKHMKMYHPCARPLEVDPEVEHNWRRLEIDNDRDDVITTIRSTMAGSVAIFGDYVIERNDNARRSDEGDDQYNDDGIDAILASGNQTRLEIDNDRDDANSTLRSTMLDAIDVFGRNVMNAFLALGNQTRRSDSDSNDLTINHETISDQMNFSGEERLHSNSLASRLSRQGRTLLNRSDRRRRNREANQNTGPPPI